MLSKIGLLVYFDFFVSKLEKVRILLGKITMKSLQLFTNLEK